MNLTLYQIAAEYREAAETLHSMDLDAQTLADTLESISGDITTKTQNVAFVARNMEANADAIEAAAKQMAARAKTLRNRAAFLRQYMLDAMLFAGVQKIDCPYFTIAIRKNPPSVQIDDERQIPPSYFVDIPAPPPQVSKTLIADALKLGVEVPGARLAAGVRLEIK